MEEKDWIFKITQHWINWTPHLYAKSKTKFRRSKVGPEISATLHKSEKLWKQCEMNSKLLSGQRNRLDTALHAPIHLLKAAQLF